MTVCLTNRKETILESAIKHKNNTQNLNQQNISKNQNLNFKFNSDNFFRLSSSSAKDYLYVYFAKFRRLKNKLSELKATIDSLNLDIVIANHI